MSEPFAVGPRESAVRADATSADFSRLEERVVQLVERHREAQKLVEELRQGLRESESRVRGLEAELARRDALRAEVRGRLEQVIEWVEALECAARAPGEPSEPRGEPRAGFPGGAERLRAGVRDSRS